LLDVRRRDLQDSRLAVKVARVALLGFSVALALAVGVGAAENGGKAMTLSQSENVDVTRLRGDDAEATVAIDPRDPDQAFVAVNPVTARRSTNGGFTWKKAGSGIGKSCCDNAAAWDSFGNLFLTNINNSLDRIPLYLSTNGGAKFKKLLDLNSSPEIDQPTVKAGPGSVWVTWNEDETIVARGAAVTGLGDVGPFTAMEPVPGSHSVGGTPIRRLPGTRQPAPGSDTLGGQFGDIAVGPGGQVVVVWQTDSGFDTCPCDIYTNTDVDGLGSGGFSDEVHVTATNVAKFDSIPPQPDRTVDAEANLQYNLSGVNHPGRLYLAYTDETPDESDNTDIYVRHSDDDGAHWSSAVKVNDDGGSTSQFLPYLAVDPTTGNLIVTWYDARNDPVNDEDVQYWGAISEDGGATFTPNFQISEGTSSALTSLDPFGFEFGDYSWVSFTHGLALPVWSDNSDSAGNNPDGSGSGLDIYTARIEVNLCDGEQATIVGTDGNDTLNGTSGDDVIAGLDGNDTIDGMGGNDTICGNDGNDTIGQGPSPDGTDAVFGGPGTDTVDYSGRSGLVTVTLDGKKKSGEKKEKDAIGSDVENAVAGSGGSKMTGSAAGNLLTGGAGKDSLSGKGGADTLNGSDGTGGNDTLDCGKNDGVADSFSFDAGPPADKVKNCP
jgi:Ca2+-binding RTX toxin-like protein